MSGWRTQIDATVIEAYQVGHELHVIFFQSKHDQGGCWDCVAVQIPEASRQQVSAALRLAHQRRARFTAVCDTAEQAQRIADRAARLLPEHQRVPYERAEAGAWGMEAVQ